MNDTYNFCIFCLSEDSMEQRSDVKSRPYLYCNSCSTRVFPRLKMAVPHYELVALLAQPNREQIMLEAIRRDTARAENIRAAGQEGAAIIRQPFIKETKDEKSV